MDPSSLPLIQALTAKMDWLTQRQQVLARNIANADTPGFTPLDLKEFQAPSAANGSSFGEVLVAQTDPHHIEPVSERGHQGREQKQRRSWETKPNGNAVSVEEQMIKSNETAMDHQMITNIYSKQLGLIKRVLGGS